MGPPLDARTFREAMARYVPRAALMGARGNSGVILSQLDRVREAFAETFPSLEVEVHRGGQPNYPLLIGLE